MYSIQVFFKLFHLFLTFNHLQYSSYFQDQEQRQYGFIILLLCNAHFKEDEFYISVFII